MHVCVMAVPTACMCVCVGCSLLPAAPDQVPSRPFLRPLLHLCHLVHLSSHQLPFHPRKQLRHHQLPSHKNCVHNSTITRFHERMQGVVTCLAVGMRECCRALEFTSYPDNYLKKQLNQQFQRCILAFEVSYWPYEQSQMLPHASHVAIPTSKLPTILMYPSKGAFLPSNGVPLRLPNASRTIYSPPLPSFKISLVVHLPSSKLPALPLAIPIRPKVYSHPRRYQLSRLRLQWRSPTLEVTRYTYGYPPASNCVITPSKSQLALSISIPMAVPGYVVVGVGAGIISYLICMRARHLLN